MRTLDGQNVPNIDAPTTEYPFGRARNSNPPAARNGTPLYEENLMTDMGYAMLSVMKAAGLIPNEQAENIDVSQFKDAILSLISTVPNPDKVIVDAPDLTISNLNLLARFTTGLGSTDFNTWVGVCEAVGKLTLTGIVQLKVRNRTVGPVLATAGTHIYTGDLNDFSAGFFKSDNDDNIDLGDTNNIIGELAEDFNFTDITTYFTVNVVLKQKPMTGGSGGGFWLEDNFEKTLTPSQPGISIEEISSEWDLDKIKDFSRVVFDENTVMFDDGAGILRIYKNLARNASDDLVSTNGQIGSSVIISGGIFAVNYYEPVGGAGSDVDKIAEYSMWDLNLFYCGGSIIVQERDPLTGVTIPGEIFYDASEDVLKGNENFVEKRLVSWNENELLKYLTPIQPGIEFEPISLQWDSNQIKNLSRVVFDENNVTYYDPLRDAMFILKNLAFNAVSQLISTNGVAGQIVSHSPNASAIEIYTPNGGAGSLVTLATYQHLDNVNGVQKINTSLVIGERKLGFLENGEITYDSAQQKFRVYEDGVLKQLLPWRRNTVLNKIYPEDLADKISIGHDDPLVSLDVIEGFRVGDKSVLKQNYSDFDGSGVVNFVGAAGLQCGSIWTNGNLSESVISASGIANRVKFVFFTNAGHEVGGVNSDNGNNRLVLGLEGLYEIIVSLTPNSVLGGGGDFGFGLFRSSGTNQLSEFAAARTLAGGGGEVGSVSMSGQVWLGANDHVELWVWNGTGTANLLITNANMAIKQIAGIPYQV